MLKKISHGCMTKNNMHIKKIVGLIEFNFRIIKNGLQKMLELNQQHAKQEFVAYLTNQMNQTVESFNGNAADCENDRKSDTLKQLV